MLTRFSPLQEIVSTRFLYVSGARQDGIVGFFRGIGLGILRLVTKPALGILDAVTFTLDSVKRAIAGGVKVSSYINCREQSPVRVLVRTVEMVTLCG